MQICNGIDAYTKWFNAKFKQNINAISEHLMKMEQTLGKRRNYNAKLCKNRMSDAFYWYTTQYEIETVLNVTLDITASERANIIQRNQERIDIHRSTQEQSTGEGQITQKVNPHDLFKHFQDKYYKHLMQNDCELLTKVPINMQDNTAHPSHFVIVADGNAKEHRPLCGYPTEDFLRGMLLTFFFLENNMLYLYIII